MPSCSRLVAKLTPQKDRLWDHYLTLGSHIKATQTVGLRDAIGAGQLFKSETAERAAVNRATHEWHGDSAPGATRECHSFHKKDTADRDRAETHAAEFFIVVA